MADVSRQGLSDEQRSVVDCDDRAIVVRASAGSGKTEVVAQRVERLLAEDAEQAFRILALSYTRRAAGELRARFEARLGPASRRVETDTVHGFAQGLLLQYGTWIGLPPEPEVVVSDADRVELLQAWRDEQGLPPLADARASLLELDLCRARRQSSPLFEDWTAALAGAGALDYEAMLQCATELMDVPAVRKLVWRLYRHVIVDEAQNLTAAQCAFLGKVIGPPDEGGGHAVLVGDDKQSIVGFAGASAEHMSTFTKRYGATELRLTKNYRSAANINALATAVARDLGDLPPEPQDFAATGAVGYDQFADEHAEAGAVATWVSKLLSQGLPVEALAPGESAVMLDRDIAVLGRSASALRGCERALTEAGIAVSVASHADDWLASRLGTLIWQVGTFRPQSSVSRRRLARELEAQGDITDRMRLRDVLSETQPDDVAEIALASTPAAFMDAVAQLRMTQDGWFEDQRELSDAWARFCDVQPVAGRGWPQFELFVSRWQRGDEAAPGVRLQTVHKSQGREYRAVVVVGLNEGQFPDFRAKDQGARRDELRAFYVAVTRPSRLLWLTRPMSTASRSGAWARSPSSFLTLTDVSMP